MSNPQSPFAHFGGHISPAVRAFKEIAEILYNRLDAVDRRIDSIEKQLDETSARETEAITSKMREEFQWQTNWLYDEMERHNRSSSTRDAHARIYLEQLFAQKGESSEEARRRLFANIAPATGNTRLFQLATAKLMNKLDSICDHLGIEYWFAYGTLVAALYRQGSIPWDDDIDICMRRNDIDKLERYLARSNENGSDELGMGFQVTTVYDKFVLCRQKRFCSTDRDLPCFIDLSIWDEASAATKEADKQLQAMRQELMDKLNAACAEDGKLAYWNENPFLLGEGSGVCSQVIGVDWAAIDEQRRAETVSAIEDIFEEYQARAIEAGLLCAQAEENSEAGNPAALAYAFDNIYDAPWRRITWPADMFLPTRKAPYEGYMFRLPNKAKDVCDECYPDSPYLPNDIFSHKHFAVGTMEGNEVAEKLLSFIRSE